MAPDPRRLELQALLRELLGSGNVYFQPPTNIQMDFPCIIYRKNDVDMFHANNFPYKDCVRYQLIVVDPDPDSVLNDKIRSLPMCAYDRSYTADELNHDVYNLYF